jgi:hypothetical protein
MHRLDRKHILAITFSASAAVLSAAAPAIGVALSQGNMIVDSGETPGNATIFDGTTLQTEKTASQIRMNDGGSLRMAMESRGTLFSDHVDLQSGSAEITGMSANANGLRISTDKAGTAAISLHGKVTQVAALVGGVHVFNSKGLIVANLEPGKAVELQDAGASAPQAGSTPQTGTPAGGGAAAGGGAGAGAGVSVTTIVIASVAAAAVAGVAIGVATTGGSTSPGQ